MRESMYVFVSERESVEFAFSCVCICVCVCVCLCVCDCTCVIAHVLKVSNFVRLDQDSHQTITRPPVHVFSEHSGSYRALWEVLRQPSRGIYEEKMYVGWSGVSTKKKNLTLANASLHKGTVSIKR